MSNRPNFDKARRVRRDRPGSHLRRTLARLRYQRLAERTLARRRALARHRLALRVAAAALPSDPEGVKG